jgi:SAM-dependent methyltransferase
LLRVTWDPDFDKAAERERYDGRARAALESGGPAPLGAEAFDPATREPFLCYEEFVRSTIRKGQDVLELGAGTGMHTRVLAETGARVMATDISPTALAVLEKQLPRFAQDDNVRTKVADIEALPFPVAAFDAVTCAGSLTYGDPAKVDAEILRVLKPGGALILVDVLNHNPIYRVNRWIHYLRGHRTRTTLSRMPTLSRLDSLGRSFTTTDVRFFGGLTWAMPLAKILLGQDRAAALSRGWDRMVGTRRSAFKFVMLARGKR